MVNIGEVRTFPDVRADKAQALKVLEEASEVREAWQAMRKAEDAIANEWPREQQDVINAHRDALKSARAALLSECADVIQAACNLLAGLGIEDFEPYMVACRERNEIRGRM